MRRRTYLSAVGVALSGGLAGCSDSGSTGEGNLSGIFDEGTPTAGPENATDSPTATATGREAATDTGTREDVGTATPDGESATDGATGGPRDTAQHFYSALAHGDVETARGLLHPDSELTEQELQQTAAALSQIQFRVEEATVLERDDDSAIVGITASTVRDGSRQTTESHFELRLDGDSWKYVQRVDRPTQTGTPEETRETGTPEETPETETPPLPPGEPAAVVEEFYAAVNRGELEEANALIHPDSPLPEINSDSAPPPETELSVDNAAVVDTTADGVIVRAMLTIGSGEQSRTNEVAFELRRNDDGEWRLWQSR